MTNSLRLSPDQFEALATLCGLHKAAPSKEIARRALVEGMAPKQAAATCGLSCQAAHNVISRLTKTYELVRNVNG